MGELKYSISTAIEDLLIENSMDYEKYLFIGRFLKIYGYQGLSKLEVNSPIYNDDEDEEELESIFTEIEAIKSSKDQKKLVELLVIKINKKLEQSIFKVDDEYWMKNLIVIAKIFKLRQNEIDFLKIIFQLSSMEFIDNALKKLKITGIKKLLKTIETLWELPKNYLRGILSRNSELIKNEIITLTNDDFNISFSDLIHLGSNFIEAVYSEGGCEQDLQRYFFQYSKRSELKKISFDTKAIDIEKLTKILLKSKRQKLEGINILIYGPAGTGKTEFIKMVAEKSSLRLALVQSDEDSRADDFRPPRYRLHKDESFIMKILSLKFCGKICENQQDAIILMDDADDILHYDDGIFTQFAGSSKNRSKLLRILEENKTPVVWIVNHYEQIDPAVKRRFACSIKFDSPGPKERISIWKNIIEESKATVDFNNQEIETLAFNYKTTPALIANCIKSSQMISGNVITLDVIKNQLEESYELMNGEKLALDKFKLDADGRDYNIDLISTSFPAEKIIQSMDYYLKDDKNNKQGGSLCFCFSGKPGTGKTEFVKYISQKLCRKVLFKKASDIISPFVGESERNIADAFEEAEKEESILFLDELDSFLFTRKNASHSWELSLVNEILTQMENFRGIFIGATNFKNKLDYACLRRFHFKVEFYPLHNDMKMGAFKTFFPNVKLPGNGLRIEFFKKLINIIDLNLGDFKAVKIKTQYLEELDPYYYLKYLQSEVNERITQQY